MKEGVVKRQEENATGVPGGVAGWLLSLIGRGRSQQPRLILLERITLAPRQSLALVEADGRRLLVATSGDKGPVFHTLDSDERGGRTQRSGRRASW